MALASAFHEFCTELARLYDSVMMLRLTVVEDKPVTSEAALADVFGDEIEDVLGLLEECRAVLTRANPAVREGSDLRLAQTALRQCQERMHKIEIQFSTNLVSYDKLKDLAHLGKHRGGEWLAWAGSVKRGLEESREALTRASNALSGCWQEMAERAAVGTVSLISTNIGPRIATRGTE